MESPYERIRTQYETTVYRIAKQFPGLEVDDPTGHCIWLEQEDGIKGGNWLTILEPLAPENRRHSRIAQQALQRL